MEKDNKEFIVPYKRYTEIRDTVWRLILGMGINKLPIKISKVLTNLNIALYTYQNNYAEITDLGLEELTKTSDGFTVVRRNQYVIFYDNTQLPARIRFTLAHELGHIILESGFSETASGIVYTTRNNEPNKNDNPEETAANMFAARLLAPSCVLHELKLFTVEEIMQYCSISKAAAEFKLERMLLLENRNARFLKEKGYGCFYLSPLECQVKQQFGEYINTVQKYRE